jgi:hypothetical protein
VSPSRIRIDEGSMSRFVVGFICTVALVACGTSTGTDPLANQFAAGTVVITVDKATYTWDEASTAGVRGTIQNTSDRTVYSNIGDAFNGSMEQDPVLIAHGSDGTVERQVGADAWVRSETAIAIEGTRFVMLRPGQAYHFIAPLAGTPRTGTHRIAVAYRSTINDEERATVGTGRSASFEIR